MTLPDVMEQLRAALREYAAEFNAQLSVSPDPWAPYELLTMGSGGSVVALVYEGQTRLDSPPGRPLAVARIAVYVGAQLGLSDERGAALFRPLGARPAVYSLVEGITKLLVDFRMTVTDGTVKDRLYYAGDEPVALPGGMPLAAYKINFTLERAVV